MINWITKKLLLDVNTNQVCDELIQTASISHQVLPVIIFASAVFSLLFYFGIMQKLIKAFAWLMHHTMGVSGVEAFGAAANVFLGMVSVYIIVPS